MRNVERGEGLALGGAASVGPVRFRLPAVLETGTTEGPGLATGSGAPGARRFELRNGPDRIEFELPILTPEITAAGPGIHRAAEGIYLLHAPLALEPLRELRRSRPELLVLGNARALWNEGEPFVAAVRAVREEVGAEPVLWAPRVALPHRVPLLAYLGIDLLDTTEGELRAANGEFLDLTLGPVRGPRAAEARGCDCPACTRAAPDDLLAHARFLYRRALGETLAALGRGALRELVEARLAAEPASAEILRYADRELAALLEARTPVVAQGSHTYVLAESLRRPEMRRFRARLLERYRPPPSKSVLLLVPCSRTKPYRNSPSHRRFASALEGLPGAERVHVVSISSPIGVVPRELEDVPPARHYDVPVTGDWSESERAFVTEGLGHLLRSGTYRKVVAHLDPEEYRFVLAALPETVEKVVTVADGRTTSAEAIDRLREELAQALEGLPAVRGGPLAVVAEGLRELASVQFGRVAAERLFTPPFRLMGRPWFQRVTDGRVDLATVREERGLFHLTVAGALRVGDAVLRVEVDPKLSLEGDLFAPGVLSADPGIRVGDSVGLFQDGRLAAVGEAALPGPLLGDLRHGLAVRVRHRRHGQGDTAKTGEPSPLEGR